jgi:hypothetical protein
MTVRSSWLTPTGQSREDTRLTQLGATLPADALRVRSGILPGSPDGTAKVAGFWLKNTSGMSATIEPGRAVVQGMATQGAYPVTLAETTPVTLSDGNAQYDRIDLICLQVRDGSYDDTGTAEAVLTVVEGEANPTPQAPDVPDLALPLYTVTVHANASAANSLVDWANAADLRTTTVAVGGVLPVYGNTAVPGSYVGQLRDVGDVLQRWNGTAWVAYPQGIGGIVPSGSGVAASYVGQYRDNAGQLQRWNGAAWQTVFPAVSAFLSSADAGSTSSATYVKTLGDTSGLPMAVGFVAPPTGAVLVTVGAAVHTTGDATTTGYISAVIAQGSTVISDAGDDRAATGTYSYQNSVVFTYRVGGLTPGASCTATCAYRATDTTKKTWFDNRFIRIEPAA